jgi:hypothetical protein
MEVTSYASPLPRDGSLSGGMSQQQRVGMTILGVGWGRRTESLEVS